MIVSSTGSEIIKKLGIIVVLVLASFAVPALGISGATMGASNVNILSGGVFENGSKGSNVSLGQPINFDSVSVGNDVATAFGNYWDQSIFGHQAKAENNVEIKKNQTSGPSICCNVSSTTLCRECAPQVNIEQIRLGDRKAFAYGNAEASNNIKIVTNQE
jgi:hypothetical protein